MQLQVVNDDEALALGLAQFAARLRACFQDGETGRVVDVQVQLGKHVRGVGDGAPVPLGYEAAANLGQAHARLGAQDTLHQLFRAHFQREEGHGRTRLGGVHRQVERERGLAHARTSSQDDEIPATEAVEQGIRILEARRHTGHVIALFGQARELFEGVHQKRVHLGERGGDAFLRDVEQGLFSFLHHLVQVVGRVVGERVDLRGGIDAARAGWRCASRFQRGSASW